MLLQNQSVNEEIKKEIKNTLRHMLMKKKTFKIYGMPKTHGLGLPQKVRKISNQPLNPTT